MLQVALLDSLCSVWVSLYPVASVSYHAHILPGWSHATPEPNPTTPNYVPFSYPIISSTHIPPYHRMSIEHDIKPLFCPHTNRSFLCTFQLCVFHLLICPSVIKKRKGGNEKQYKEREPSVWWRIKRVTKYHVMWTMNFFIALKEYNMLCAQKYLQFRLITKPYYPKR